MTGGQARAVARLARRTARREWRRTTLVALLVMVPVAAGVVVAGIMRAADVTPAEQATSTYGQAQVRVEFWPGEATDALRGQDGPPVAAWLDGAEVVDRLVRQASGDAEVVRYREFYSSEGRMTDLDLTAPVTEGMLELVDGRAPATPDEIAASPALLTQHDAILGDTMTLWDGTELTVVGEVIDPLSVNVPVSVVQSQRLEQQITAADGAWSAWDGSRPVWLVDDVDDVDGFAARVTEGMTAAVPDGVPSPSREPTVGDARGATQAAPVETGFPPSVEVGTRAQLLANTLPSSHPNRDRVLTPQVIATLVTSILLAEVALIAGAAYATGARRRLRELGLLGANGATSGHLRAAVVGEATVTGIIGGLAGVLTGVAALHLGRPVVQQFVGPLITRTELSVTDLIGPALTAVLAVSLAAWLPARTAARVPTTTALQGRMPLAEPRRWLTPAGLLLAGLGALLLLVGLLAGDTEGGVVAALGALAAIGGMAMLTVPIIAALGRVADRLPAMLRLVIRDSGRQRTRAAAASASAMVVLIAPILVATISMSDQQQQLVQGLPYPDNHVYAPPNAHTDSVRADVPSNPDAPSDEVRADTLATLRDQLSDADQTAVTLLDERARLHHAPQFDPVSADQGMVDIYTDSEAVFWQAGPDQGTYVAVATPALLDALGLPAATEAIDDGAPVVLGLADRPTTAEVAGQTVNAREMPAQVVHGFPRLLLTPDRVDGLGLDVAGTAELFVTEEPISAHTASGIYRTVNTLDISVGAAGFRNGPLLRWLAVAATLAVALLILALVTMLSATESDHDVRTMVAVGAAPRIRRRFLGLQSTVHALVGAVLATPLGLALAWAALATQDDTAIGAFGSVNSSSLWLDWSIIAAVLLAVPAAIGLVIAALVRSAPTVPPRRLG